MKRKLSVATVQRICQPPKKVSSAKAASERFTAELRGAKIDFVNPEFLFPLILDRDRHESGVQKMVRILRGDFQDGSSCGDTNVCAGSGTPIVVTVTDIYRPYFRNYLVSLGLSESEIAAEMDEAHKWRGIVDGNYRFWAILYLRRANPDIWMSFRWSVLVLHCTPPLDRLFQLKRSLEFNRKPENVIEVTLFDEYNRMYREYKRLKKDTGKEPEAAEVAMAYDGNKHNSKDAISQKVRTAIRLGESVIACIGEIMNEECPHLVSLSFEDGHPGKDPTKTSQYKDTRVHIGFVTNSCLTGATAFLKNEGETNDNARLYTLRRLRLISRANGNKGVNIPTVLDQFNRAKMAQKETLKFEELIGSVSWPEGLLVLKSKIQESSDLDDEIALHAPKGPKKILDSILNEYRRLYPDDAVRNEAKYNAMTNESTDKAANVPNEPGLETEDAPTVNDNRTSEVMDNTPKSVLRLPQAEKIQRMCAALKSVDIEVINSTWEHYFLYQRTSADKDFDYIHSDPPFGTPQPNPASAGSEYNDDLEDSDFSKYCAETYKSLKNGSYSFFYSSCDYAPKWKSALRSNNFLVWNGLYALIRSMQGRQLTRISKFPQVFVDFGVISIKPGCRKDGFKPPFNEPYTMIACKYPRRLGVIDKIPVARPKLLDPHTKKPLRVCEKDENTTMEIMRTYCPMGGHVFDGFGGTLKTALACLKTGRSCVVVEKDKHCFEIAVERLHEVYLELYTDKDGEVLRFETRLSQTELEQRRIGRSGTCVESTNGSGDEYDQEDIDTEGNGEKKNYTDTNIDLLDSYECQDKSRNGQVEKEHSGDDDSIGRSSMDEDLEQWSCRLSQSTAVHSESQTNSLATDIYKDTHCVGDKVSPMEDSPDNDANNEEDNLVRNRPETMEQVRDHVKRTQQPAISLYNSAGHLVGFGKLGVTYEGEDKDNMRIGLRERIHGNDLKDIEEDYGPHVIVTSVMIMFAREQEGFEGAHVGTDEEIEKLKDITADNFYLWPLQQIELKE